MANQTDRRDSEKDTDTSKGPVAGQGRTAPKVDPTDGAAVNELTKSKQPATGPKAD